MYNIEGIVELPCWYLYWYMDRHAKYTNKTTPSLGIRYILIFVLRTLEENSLFSSPLFHNYTVAVSRRIDNNLYFIIFSLAPTSCIAQPYRWRSAVHHHTLTVPEGLRGGERHGVHGLNRFAQIAIDVAEVCFGSPGSSLQQKSWPAFF